MHPCLSFVREADDPVTLGQNLRLRMLRLRGADESEMAAIV